MNTVGRKILNAINNEIKKSDGKYGTYIPVSIFKQCIKRYHPSVEATLEQMIKKEYAFYSKSGKAITLSKGLIDGFTPFTCSDVYECLKFVEYQADNAVADFGKISDTEWFYKYAFDSFLVSEYKESTSKHWNNIAGIIQNKKRLNNILKDEYWDKSSRHVEEQKRQAEEEARRQAEEETRKENTEEKQNNLLKAGPYCVEFLEIITETFWPEEPTEYDPEDLTPITKENKILRFFETSKEAKDFADFLKKERYSLTYDGANYLMYDWTQFDYSYKIMYCGKNTGNCSGNVTLIIKENESALEDALFI